MIYGDWFSVGFSVRYINITYSEGEMGSEGWDWGEKAIWDEKKGNLAFAFEVWGWNEGRRLNL